MKAAATKTQNPPPKIAGEKDFLDKVDEYLGKKSRLFYGLALGCTILFSLLLFDARLSFATDDATYIMNAVNFIKHNVYPNFQGALYPFFLALIIKLFGLKLVLLKFFSVIFMALQVVFLYKALKGRIPELILFAGIFVIAFNAYILAYASSTFAESFYMMIQALAVLIFFRLTDKLEQPGVKLQNSWKEWLLFGFVFLLYSLAKNVALFAIIAVCVYFLFRKEWLNAIVSLVSFAIFKLPYELMMRAFYGDISSQQTQLLLRKDFHDPSKGTVGIADLIDRFIGNFGNYISVHTFKMLGLRGEGVWSIFTMEKSAETVEPMAMQPSIFYGFIFIVLFALSLYYSYKYNRYLFFIVLLTAVSAGVTFFALHTFWNQDRLIMFLLPFLFMIMVYAIYGMGKTRRFNFLKYVLPFLISVLLLIQLGTTLSGAARRSKFVSHYLRGDYLYGYPPSIQNYLKACQWAGKNLPDSSQVLCDKPAEADVYSNKQFYTRLPNPIPQDPDSLISNFKQKHITHFLIGGAGSGNVSAVAQFLYQRNPAYLEQIYQEGDLEPVFLFKFHYLK